MANNTERKKHDSSSYINFAHLEEHRHMPLEIERSIRVIELSPAPNDDEGAPIVCSLRQIPLDAETKYKNRYHALSYVWGGRTGSEAIICDGKKLLVTPNCMQALRTIRANIELLLNIDYLWVDAICIDQKEDPSGKGEKSHQVALMGEVYQHARSVIIWLGHISRAATQHLEYMKKVGKHHMHRKRVKRHYKHMAKVNKHYKVTKDNPPKRQLMAEAKIEKWIERIKISAKNAASVKGTRSFWGPVHECPWFWRVWTLQEIAFARRPVLLYMPKNERKARRMSWVDAESTKKWWDINNFGTFNDWYMIPDRLTMSSMLGLLPSMTTDRRNYNSKCLKAFSYLWMKTLHILEAVDERDYVYGLDAVLRNIGLELLEIDYSIPWEAVFERFTCKYLVHTQDVSLLIQAPRYKRSEKLASWAFDFKSPSPTRSYIRVPLDEYTGVNSLISKKSGQLSFAGRRITKIRYSDDISGATERARLFEEYKPIPPFNQSRALAQLKIWLKKARKVLSQMSDRDMARTLKLLVICPREESFFADAALDYLEEVSQELQYLLHEDDALADTGSTSIAFRPRELCEGDYDSIDSLLAVDKSATQTSDATSLTLENDKNYKVTELPDLIKKWLQVCNLLITTNGKLGFGFCTILPEDEVVLIHGCKIPIVVRPKADKFQYVAPAHFVDLIDPYLATNDDPSVMEEFTLV
ncbi:unnamed protein product [Periconia digitata]|uniref:Heterokaryon incompatibility domain-containing protein n=1 Tax=Periconia digitata TaxID=1303443 RepID=A0A9W4XZ24_9PLEO|nr:unnamed protein product [Periconia digitata]